MFILCINAMIWIMKAFRHSQSIEIVLPKPLCKELGWGFNTHFVVEPHGDKQADYEKGFQPYRDAIEKTTLPARFARRDPRNLERVRAQVNAVIAEKQRQIG